jgi:hypothetical protein
MLMYGKNILAIDWSKGVIHNFDLNCNYINSFNPNGCLKNPSGICVQIKENGDEVIFVSDLKAKLVFLFNSLF